MKVATSAERAALCADVLEQALLVLRDLPALGSWGEVFGAVQEAIAGGAVPLYAEWPPEKRTILS